MRQTIFILVIIFLGTSAAWCQNAPVRELGVRFDGINLGGQNDFSVVYKKQKADNKYARWRAAYSSLSARHTDDFNNFGLGFGLHYGIERRKSLTDKFAFAFGPEAGIGFSVITQNDRSPATNASVRLGYVLGLQYNFARTFFLNLETIPHANLGLSANGDNSVWAFGLAFVSNAALTLGCKF